MFHSPSPILRVKNLETSIEYYTKRLGFVLDWHDPEILASVSRDQCQIMLAEGDQGNCGSWVWIGIADTTTLFEEFKKTGAIIRHLPANYWWAYEMQVADPDGNVIRFGSESKKDIPFGNWLDMYGNIWHVKIEQPEKQKENI